LAPEKISSHLSVHGGGERGRGVTHSYGVKGVFQLQRREKPLVCRLKKDERGGERGKSYLCQKETRRTGRKVPSRKSAAIVLSREGGGKKGEKGGGWKAISLTLLGEKGVALIIYFGGAIQEKRRIFPSRGREKEDKKRGHLYYHFSKKISSATSGGKKESPYTMGEGGKGGEGRFHIGPQTKRLPSQRGKKITTYLFHSPSLRKKGKKRGEGGRAHFQRKRTEGWIFAYLLQDWYGKGGAIHSSTGRRKKRRRGESVPLSYDTSRKKEHHPSYGGSYVPPITTGEEGGERDLLSSLERIP